MTDVNELLALIDEDDNLDCNVLEDIFNIENSTYEGIVGRCPA